jgi:hypothetical protein
MSRRAANEFELVINLKTAKALGLTNPAIAAGAGGSGHRVSRKGAKPHKRPAKPSETQNADAATHPQW